MKLRLIMFILFMTTYLNTVPTTISPLYIEEPKQINVWAYYEPLIKAVATVESNNNTLAYNATEGAVGALQIRQCRLDHYNKLNKSDYKLSDCYNYETARRIFLYFAAGKSYEQAAKDWNGSGPMTNIYWQKVNKELMRNANH